ncbi:MAG: hypothetical protein IPJ19_12055 [Planctomycetes bacterium]|nr:hypothetical protein [Planctomycetota bacterium]
MELQRCVGSVFLAALAALLPIACTSVPKPGEILGSSFRSPEQCLRSFQFAVRSDEPAWEYRCFSTRFRAENHLSQLAWRELREQLWGQIGMRWAVAKAEPRAPASVHGARAEMVVEALGKRVHLSFLREDFGETWSGETQLSDDEVDFRTHTGTQDGKLFYGQVPMPPDLDSAKVTEMRIGREWKLDDIRFDAAP